MQTDNNNTQVVGKWKFSGTTIRNGKDFQSWQSLISNDAETMTVARACATSEEDAKQRAIFIVEAVNNYSKLVELRNHILAMENDAYLSSHPEWNEIINNAKNL